MTDDNYPPEIEAAYANLPPPDADDYLDRLGRAPIEVAVRARREADADRVLQRRIDSMLAERALPLIRRAAKRHGRAPDSEVEDIASEMMLLFWSAIQDGSFAERRFNKYLKLLALQAGKRVRGGKQRERERNALTIGLPDPDGQGVDAPLDVADRIDDYARAEARMMIEDALSLIDGRQADAVILHELHGFPIHSHDPAVQTVASLCGYRERTARRLLQKGRDELRRVLMQEDDDG